MYIRNELALKLLNIGKEGYKDDNEGFRKLKIANKLIEEYEKKQLQLNPVNKRFDWTVFIVGFCVGLIFMSILIKSVC